MTIDYVVDTNIFILLFNNRLDEAIPESRYLVLHSAWRGESRIYGCAIQLDLIEGKVWIQHNSTEVDLYQELIQQGVEAKDIVLGFRSPAVRQKLAEAF